MLLPEFFGPALGTMCLANAVLEVLCSNGFKFANDEQRKNWAVPLAKLRSSVTSSSILRNSKCISTSAMLLQLCDSRAERKTLPQENDAGRNTTVYGLILFECGSYF